MFFLAKEMGGEKEQDDTDQNIEMWKIKKLIKSLTEARGNGTSMISLVIPVSSFISRYIAKGPDFPDFKDVGG